MAVYRCEECDTWKDNDYHPCEQHPTHENELICPACMVEMPEKKFNTPETEQWMRDTIKKMEAYVDGDEEE